MSNYTLTKPPLIASITALISLAILVNLSAWQWGKYQRKSLYQSAICSNQAVPVHAENFSSIKENSASFCPGKARFTGTLDPDFHLSVGPRAQGGNPGFHIYSILRGSDDSALLVNLGWAPAQEPPLQIPQERINISGDLIKPGTPGMLAMPNKPEDNIWKTLDIAAIQNHFRLTDIAPYVLIARQNEPEVQSSYLEPAELSNTYLTPQMHLQYALFWAAMALALSVIFTFRFALKRK